MGIALSGSRRAILCLGLLAGLSIGSVGVVASDNPILRATNMARIKAEILNGGLRYYRAASCMYQSNGGECLVDQSQSGFTYQFLGGPPGWQQLEIKPTVETQILVAPDGRSILNVIYNGPLRQPN